MFTGQGVEKNNDDAKKLYFQKSNKWDATRDVLLLESRQYALKHKERKKRRYTKQKADYWESAICVNRKRKPLAAENNNTPSTSRNETCWKPDFTKMTVKELKKEITERGLKPKGFSKMKKKDLCLFLNEFTFSI